MHSIYINFHPSLEVAPPRPPNTILHIIALLCNYIYLLTNVWFLIILVVFLWWKGRTWRPNWYAFWYALKKQIDVDMLFPYHSQCVLGTEARGAGLTRLLAQLAKRRAWYPQGSRFYPDFPLILVNCSDIGRNFKNGRGVKMFFCGLSDNLYQ